MKQLIIIMLPLLILSACSEINDPYNEDQQIPIIGGCWVEGLQLHFTDTCSYSFVVPFLSELDSISITQISLGRTYNLYASTGSIGYWYSFFQYDSTIFSVSVQTGNQDSLFLIIKTTGELSLDREVQKYSNMENLVLLEFEESPKSVMIRIPINSENFWKEYFEQFSFITEIIIIAVCVDQA